MFEAPHYSPAGAKRAGAFTLPEPLFDGTVNEPVLHQTVKAYLNNQRQGTSATKTRSFVSGGNQKPWKQKGTGRARQGSIRAPHWRGGGIVFGPQPRDYHTEVPRKVKQLARKSAFNARAREGRLHVVEKVTFAAPKTKQLAELLGNLGLEGVKVLVLTNGANRNAWLSSRNLPTVHVMPYAEVSAYDVIWSDALVVEEGAITGVEPEIAPEPEQKKPSKVRAAAKAVKAKAVKAEKAEAKATKKTRQEGGQGPGRQEGGEEGRREAGEEVRRRRRRGSEHVTRPAPGNREAARDGEEFRRLPAAEGLYVRGAPGIVEAPDPGSARALFDVNVTDVRTMQMRRNEVTRGRTRGTTARWKKAIVTLRDGQTLPVFEG